MLQSTVTLPVFASSSGSFQPPSTAQGAANESEGLLSGLQPGEEWQMDTSNNANDSMDFDLLAEYLLDDTSGGPSGAPFDFNAANANGTVSTSTGIVGLVSPEQSEDDAMPPGAANNMAGQSYTTQIQPTQSTPVQQASLIALQQQQLQQQQPQLAAAALISSQLDARSPQVQVPMAPSFAPHQGGQFVQNIAVPQIHPGAATAAAAATVPQQIPAIKRRRVDEPATASAPSPAPAPAQAMVAQMPAILNDPIAVAAALQNRGRKKSQAQIDRRRERNRILARRTRLRKKFFFESLQKEVMDLQRENSALKDIVRGQLDGEEGQRLLEECDASEKLPAAVVEACGEQASEMDQQDFNLVKSIQQSQHCFIITDPSLQDNPIVFASDDFLSLTGYSREDVLGRNCRFLQGTNTSETKVASIRKGIANGDDVSVTLVNYTADGTPFWNKLFIAALRDAQNNIVNFIGVIVKVASPEPDDPEYGTALPGESNDPSAYATSSVVSASTAAAVADGTVQAIEEAVDAAVASANGGQS